MQNASLTFQSSGGTCLRVAGRYFRRLFRADAARISSPLGERLFLIIGTKRNTRQDQGRWVNEKGEFVDWDYLLESCVASGEDLSELVENAKYYKGLLDLNKDCR